MTTEQRGSSAKVGLLESAKQLGNVSQACRGMGFSSDSFLSIQDRYHKTGEAALHEISSRKPALKNRVAAVSSVGLGLPHLRQRHARAAPQSPQNFFRADSR
jgi:hypothetical protein